jgi:hypothetical protein
MGLRRRKRSMTKEAAEMKRAPRKAGMKPSTRKPTSKISAHHSVMRTMMALMTKMKRPRVSIWRGQVRKRRMGLTMRRMRT